MTLMIGACASTPRISQADIASVKNGKLGALLLAIETTDIPCPVTEIDLRHAVTDETVAAKIVKSRRKALDYQMLALPAGAYKVERITCINHTEDSQFFYKETHAMTDLADTLGSINISAGSALYPGTISITRQANARSMAVFDMIDQSVDIRASTSEETPALASLVTHSQITSGNTATVKISRNRQHTRKPKTVNPSAIGSQD